MNADEKRGMWKGVDIMIILIVICLIISEFFDFFGLFQPESTLESLFFITTFRIIIIEFAICFLWWWRKQAKEVELYKKATE